MKSVEDIFGISISNGDLFRPALTHPSYTKENDLEYDECYERLEFLGDAVLKLLVSDLLYEKYPEAKIYIVDSLAASSGYGLLMDKLADLRDEGKSVEEVKERAEKNRLTINHRFFSTDLKYFVRGGRISKTSGFLGNMLHVCPLLNVNNEGKLIPREKILGKKKVINAIVQKMVENAENGKDYDDYCYISHSAVYEDAKAVKDKVEENFPKLAGKVETGPGTVALFFVGKERKN